MFGCLFGNSFRSWRICAEVLHPMSASAERLMEVEQYEDADVSVICSADTDIAEHKRDVLQDVSFSIAKAIMWRLPELPAVASLPC